ncbi:AfsR/SARP family transcriptional regulator [Actinomadura litoris]|uniref:AfsR/SARP family transcriptional regulator n=1 Tax=Actinomadura litoris TaxID=2678616 RepID=UPI001FA6CDF3|nr:AfsR/SARP family transcriptional regulator [Actinomadura litoris]
MRFSVLGTLEARDEDGAVELSPKLRDLLALLLCAPNAAVGTERLVDGLWGEASPRSARTTLRGYASHLRRALGEERLTFRSGGYVLLVRDGELDAARFTELAGTGRRALAAGDHERGAALLREAAALWRGVPFDGQDHLAAVRREAVRLGELRLAATEARIDADLALGRHADLVGELRCVVVDDPFRERPRAQLMLALYRLGRAAEALEVLRETRALFAAELGLDVSPSLRALERAILSHHPVLGLGHGLGRGLALSPAPGTR